jgi:uroporphyrinogen-III decarboxylase
VVREWLEAQAEVLPGFAGVMVLDDVIGFLSPADYLEFAHPLLKEIFDLPVPVKILHNDSNSTTCYDCVADLGVNVFQFSHLRKIDAVRGMVGDTVCLLGNVPPLDILVNGTPEQARASARECLRMNAGHPRFLLSAGGGASPGTRAENIEALCAAARDSVFAGLKAGAS